MVCLEKRKSFYKNFFKGSGKRKKVFFLFLILGLLILSSVFFVLNRSFTGNSIINLNLIPSGAINLTACGELNITGGFYVLRNDIQTNILNCFNITADNIILDGHGYTLTGNRTSNSTGVRVESRNNLTIERFKEIANFSIGILFNSTKNSVILNNTANSNTGAGILLLNSSGNQVINNLAKENLASGGIVLTDSLDNQIMNNIMNSNLAAGILLFNSSGNQIINNTADSNTGAGISFFNSSGNGVINNILNSNAEGILLSNYSSENQLVNNRFINNSFQSAVDYNETFITTNFLVYNNSFGKIEWTNDSFLNNLNFKGDLGLKNNLSIGKNTAYVNVSSFNGKDLNFLQGINLIVGAMNSSANITLYGLNFSGSFSPVILRNGVECMNCYNFTPLNLPTVKFRVPYVGGNYTISAGKSKVSTTPPVYSAVSVNTTLANESVEFSILYKDNSPLEPNGQYIFSTNNSGVWTNDTAINFTETPEWILVTKLLNSTSGLSIGYRWYAKDNSGNINDSEVNVLTTISNSLLIQINKTKGEGNLTNNLNNKTEVVKVNKSSGRNSSLGRGNSLGNLGNTLWWLIIIFLGLIIIIIIVIILNKKNNSFPDNKYSGR